MCYEPSDSSYLYVIFKPVGVVAAAAAAAAAALKSYPVTYLSLNVAQNMNRPCTVCDHPSPNK
jgi:hypothetical protein